MTIKQSTLTARIENVATRIIVCTLGVLVGIGSIDHGLLETAQGNRPTPGLIINALGPGYSWSVWKEGGEGAFTLIPNFLVTGLIATSLGVLMIFWALCFLSRKHGPAGFLLLGIASFLTGGGIAQVVLFTIVWGFATRIHAPLRLTRRLIPPSIRPLLDMIWPWTLTAATILFLTALEIAIFGYVPGVSNQTHLLHICWTILGIALSLFFLSILSGFARDIEILYGTPARTATSALSASR
ncbi:MAG: hypothetical protein WCF54_06890 [Terracidiphilus sp.]